MRDACALAIKALAPAASAGARAKFAERYQQEWADELERRRATEGEAAE